MSGADVILVGDSAAMTVLGHDSTVPATMDEMLVLTRAVTRGARRPLVVADMPFGSFQVSDEPARHERDSVRQGCRRGCGEARGRRDDALAGRSAIVGAGIPVMGHIGLTPQSATALGGFKAQGRTAAKAAPARRATRSRSRRPAAFRSCSRLSPPRSRRAITELLTIPTIGIGAGAGVRRPGARLARPARPVRRPCTPVRQAVRAARDRDPAGARGVRRRTSGSGAFPEERSHVRDAGRGARRLRGGAGSTGVAQRPTSTQARRRTRR